MPGSSNGSSLILSLFVLGSLLTCRPLSYVWRLLVPYRNHFLLRPTIVLLTFQDFRNGSYSLRGLSQAFLLITSYLKLRLPHQNPLFPPFMIFGRMLCYSRSNRAFFS